MFSIKPDYKRHIKPINITSYVHTSAALVNTVTITWQDDVIYPQVRKGSKIVITNVFCFI